MTKTNIHFDIKGASHLPMVFVTVKFEILNIQECYFLLSSPLLKTYLLIAVASSGKH